MSRKSENINFYEVVMRDIGGNRRSTIGLRMTPMVDIIFLLLTFFVLTAKFQDVEKTLQIFLPKIQGNNVVEQNPLIIELKYTDGETRIHIQNIQAILLSSPPTNNELLSITQTLKNVLSSAYPSIEVNCDDAVSWDQVVKVYDVLYALGGENITFRYRE